MVEGSQTSLKKWYSRHPLQGTGLLLVLLVFAVLLAERWRGQWALWRWKHRAAARGEVFGPSRIWPASSAQGRAFSNQVDEAMAKLPPSLARYSDGLSGMILKGPGVARRGSQEPSPYLVHLSKGTNRVDRGDWAEMEQEIRAAQPALELLRKALRNPPADMGYATAPRLDVFDHRSMANAARACRPMQAATLLDVHRGDLAGATQNLVALAGFSKLFANEPSFSAYVVRLYLLASVIGTAWDALQSDSWTEAQLNELQRAFQCDDLFAQLPRTIEAERALELYELDWFSAHSYYAWVARHESIYASQGYTIPTSAQVFAIRYFRQWAFHPLWRFAWADQEKLMYLKVAQQELEIFREAVKTGSARDVCRRMDSLRDSYRPPRASWRFYLYVPLDGHMSERMGASFFERSSPYLILNWSGTLRNLTLCQMVTAAIAIKRYETRYGKPPVSLEALVPEFLGRVPRDYMDGQTLRYRVRSDGSYCLYSVGADACDDQGSVAPPPNDHEPASVWSGRDWVWPRVAVPAVTAQR